MFNTKKKIMKENLISHGSPNYEDNFLYLRVKQKFNLKLIMNNFFLPFLGNLLINYIYKKENPANVFVIIHWHAYSPTHCCCFCSEMTVYIFKPNLKKIRTIFFKCQFSSVLLY